MKRIMMQLYVKGSIEAVKLYQKAFQAELTCEYKHEDGTYYHSELDVYGQTLAVSELLEETAVTGNLMQFCLHFNPDEKELVKRAYEALKPGAKILKELGPCDYSDYMADLIDCFGVRWCLFAD